MRRTLLLAVGLAAVLTACRVDATVAVDVRPDGAGDVEVTVRLDPAAARRTGDVAAAVQTGDLVEAGWTVAAPVVADDGAVTLRASRDFASPDQLAEVLDEVGGRDGLFRRTRLEVADGFAATTYDFATDVRLTGSLEQFSDPEVAAALGGLPLGRTPAELDAEGATGREAAGLTLTVDLPGAEPRSWTRSASSGSPSTVEARTTSTVRTLWPYLLAGAGSLVVLGGVVVVVRRPN